MSDQVQNQMHLTVESDIRVFPYPGNAAGGDPVRALHRDQDGVCRGILGGNTREARATSASVLKARVGDGCR